MLDEISEKAEEICSDLDMLTDEEQKEVVETYFQKYMDNRIEIIVSLLKKDGTAEMFEPKGLTINGNSIQINIEE